MLPLAHWPLAERRALAGLFTDIDDTLTAGGAITADALAALAALRAAGLKVIAITGRPVGWSEPFAATWPLDAIVAENGAVALLPPAPGPGLGSAPAPVRKLYLQDAATRAANFQRLQAAAARVLREVPGAQLARDSAGRETDIAIDHSEYTQLPQAAIDAAQRILQAEGLTATVSSIHINGWLGTHNKWQGACWIARTLLGLPDLARHLPHWAYVGDSTNDQVMFQHFAHSVGVANIRHFAPRLAHLPRYVTQAERGAGFAEVAQAILAARQ